MQSLSHKLDEFTTVRVNSSNPDISRKFLLSDQNSIFKIQLRGLVLCT